jgi:hypothetical protein
MEKVEKVVKAPRKPTVSKARSSGDGDQNSAITSINTPKRKEPSTFTLSVPNGKPPLKS